MASNDARTTIQHTHPNVQLMRDSMYNESVSGLTDIDSRDTWAPKIPRKSITAPSKTLQGVSVDFDPLSFQW